MQHAHTIVLIAAGLALAGSTAGAQDALGDGRGLDNNLQQGNRYNAPGRNIAQEVRFRNAIVTGNAPGGASFRGDVGYTAPGEFRGVLGSDSTFAFRRDTLYSGLAGAGIRGTDALQYQFALTTGSRPPQDLAGSLSYTRGAGQFGGGVRSVPGGVPSGGVNGASPTLARVGPDDTGPTALTSILRSTGAYDATRGYQPYLLTRLETETTLGAYALSASPLRGLRVSPFAAQEEDDERDPPASRVETAYDVLLERVRERASAFDAATDGATPEVGGPLDPPDPSDPDWAQRMYELRQRLQGIEPAPVDDGALPEGTTPEDEGAEAVEEDPGEEAAERARSLRFDPETMRMIRDDGAEISRLIGETVALDDQYTLHMRSGESALERKRYFDAEERFTLAVSIRPGDVSAQVGRVHAQLGAGLIQSAGINLREVMVIGPEVAGARFSGRLLPSAKRVSDLKRMLRENVGVVEGRRDPPSPKIIRESGLLLAYLGYQSRDRSAIEQGLNAWARAVEQAVEEGVDERADIALHKFLSELWLAPEEPADADRPGDDDEGGG